MPKTIVKSSPDFNVSFALLLIYLICLSFERSLFRKIRFGYCWLIYFIFYIYMKSRGYTVWNIGFK